VTAREKAVIAVPVLVVLEGACAGQAGRQATTDKTGIVASDAACVEPQAAPFMTMTVA